MDETLTCTIPAEFPSCVAFCLDSKWVMKIEKGGIRFNREEFPLWTPDEFANTVLFILENKGIILNKYIHEDLYIKSDLPVEE